MVKLSKIQQDALIEKASAEVEKQLVNKLFGKDYSKEKLIGEWRKIQKEKDAMYEKYRALDKKVDDIRDKIRDKYKSEDFSIEFYSHDGRISISNWKMQNRMRNELALITLDKDANANEIISRLVSALVK